MIRKSVLIITFSSAAILAGVVRSDELVPVQPSTVPNLGAPMIAARQQAKADIGDVVERGSKWVLSLVFDAAFKQKSADLVAQGKAKVDNGAQVAVLVAEIYTNPLIGSMEMGPMTVVDGASVMDALKTYAKNLSAPRLYKSRPGMKLSYRIMVLSKANPAAGFLQEAFPDALMSVATQQLSVEENARVIREVARDAAKAAAAEKAREIRNRTSRDHEGARGDSGLGGSAGRRGTESSTKGSDANDKKSSDPKDKKDTKDSDANETEIRILL